MARPTLWMEDIPRRASAVTDLVVESIVTMKSVDVEGPKVVNQLEERLPLVNRAA